jgi:hypothetical protein
MEDIRKAVMVSPYRWGDPPPSEPPLMRLPNSATTTRVATTNPVIPPLNRLMSWTDCTLGDLLAQGFVAVDRVAANAPNLHQVIRECEEKGEPVIIEGLNKGPQWDVDLFSLEKFQALSPNHGKVFYSSPPLSKVRLFCLRCRSSQRLRSN